MNEPQLYLNLVNRLLTCDEGGEGEILRENADLVDAELVAMMERVVSVLEERDAKQQAEWLQELANRLGGSLEMPSVDGREEREVYQQVRSLERRFGKGHLYFAYHAAFPLALTPDLCYQIWANFQRDVGGKLLNIPWIAVADLLLSGLCHPVGHELYEMDLAVRNLLLKELSDRLNFGEERIEELSRFMLEYVKEQINSEDEDVRDFATVQRWTALAYVRPDAAARELALTLREKVREGNKAELVRLSSVLENLAEPLRGKYEPLLVYSRGMGRLARGDSEGASSEFQGLGDVENWLSVSRVGLPIPGEGDVFDDLRLRLEWKEISEKRRQEYLNLIQLLLDCSAGEEGEILRRHQSLVDLVLVKMMRQVVATLQELGEVKAAGFLAYLAEKLAKAFYPYPKELPKGLLQYYEQHWQRMEMERENRRHAILLSILIQAGTPVSSKLIAETARRDENEVVEVLEKWRVFLRNVSVEGQECYTAYHYTFVEFLQEKPAIKREAAKLLAAKNDRIREALTADEGEADEEEKFARLFESLSPDDRRVYLNDPQLEAEAGQVAKYYDLLSNFEFLAAKIRHPEFGVEALIEDYYLMAILDEDLPGRDVETERALRTIQQALQMSVHTLKEETQLARQLLGRVLSQLELPQIQKLLAQAQQYQEAPGSPLISTLTGHTSYVTAVALTPDGTKIVSVSEDKTLKIWDLAMGKELATLTGHTSHVTAVALTPDGTKIVSVSEDKTLKIWDLATGKELATLTGHTSHVTAVALTPDGTKAISGSEDKTLKIWDLAMGKELATLTGHTSYVTAVALTPDGTKIVSGSEDKTLKIWDLAMGKELATLTGHTSYVTAVALTPDGTKIVSGSEDKTLKIWDLATVRELATLTGHTSHVTAVALTPGGTKIVSVSEDKTLKIWDLATGKELATFTGHTSYVTAVALTPDGAKAISGSGDKTLKIWDLVMGYILMRFVGEIP